MCKAVLCMWWQLAVLPIKTTVITCMLHKQTTTVSLYMYNKCCSAWQQLRDVKKHTFWCSYVLDSLQNIVCECAQIQNTCMKEESAKNFGATNSRYLTENVRCIYTDTELYFKSDLTARLKPNYYKIQMHVADKRNYKQLCVQCNKNQMHFMLDNMSDNLFI